ncbi:uncharacterized protein Dwil_GK20495 [Drosophila willistoni]|uniref:GK20495 n=1 Tax=Drosophila willistoni TaxID=7260 RepID=B4N530_DROWI|nr:uncharacterized protein LOC6645692 [Drosophila willistoni]EDW79469.1 uncharacterized protein Dwil_GK20495 [Drosophila willistoni]
MLAQEIAPTEIGKHANIIRVAQEELANMDVLVCGRCLRAYNFVEEFQAHKEDACEKENANLKESLDTKPTIWAFTLWKATQLHQRKETANSNSWALYQHWVKLEDSVREPWIVAGKTIQSFGKIGHGQLQDMPVRITKTVVNPSNSNNTSNSTNNSSGSSNNASTRRSSAGKLPTLANQLKDTENEWPTKAKGALAALPAISTSTPKVNNNNRMATRVDTKTEQCTEEAVEKIVAKRFNPRRKTHEYLVKWVDRSHHENTWEAMANLDRVPYFLQMFEKQLARQKLTREKGLDAMKRLQPQSKTSEATSTTVALNTSSSPGAVSPPSRPSRTSKTKAMDAFKQWVNESGANEEGSTSPSPSSANEDDEDMTASPTPGAGVKRKLNHSGGSILDGSSIELGDLEEDLIPSHTVKRLKNGGSSVQLNKPREKPHEKSAQVAKINGNSSAFVAGGGPAGAANNEHKMGEIIYTEDSTSSGMFRKPEMPNTLQMKKDRVECPVRVLARSEIAGNSRGVFRIAGEIQQQQQQQQTVQQQKQQQPEVSPTKISPVGGAKRFAVSRAVGSGSGSGSNSPITVGLRQQVLRTPGQQAAAIQRRPNQQVQQPLRQQQQQQTQLAARGKPPPKIIARAGAGTVGTPQHQQQQQRQVANVGNRLVTPEQKILQLSKSGDLKVTRKVVSREDLLTPRANQVRQQQRQQTVQQKLAVSSQQQQQPLRGGGGGLLTPKLPTIARPAVTKPTQASIQLQVPKAEDEEEEIQQHQAQLCPITGKLIGQEESQLKMEQEQQQEQQREQLEAAAQALLGNDQQVLTNEDGSALLVRGEDGTVYQVAGKNAEGQTILVTQGPDGEQQFAYVAAAEGDEQDVISLDHAVAEAVQGAAGGTEAQTADGEQILVSMTEDELAQHQAALLQQQQQTEIAGGVSGGAPSTAQIHITTSDSDGTEAQIPAEVVQADLPSPGGTRRVVLLLQDGTFMMTEMHEDQFKTLNIPT